jgi:protein HOOK3
LSRTQAATDQIIKNLQRENAMITTAWYDLTSRLQSNHVVLQRRHDAPRSWLNKQRQMVNATPRR